MRTPIQINAYRVLPWYEEDCAPHKQIDLLPEPYIEYIEVNSEDVDRVLSQLKSDGKFIATFEPIKHTAKWKLTVYPPQRLTTQPKQ